MKILLLLVFFAAFALCQNSTNPEGYPFFSATLVKELPLNSTVSSVITTQPGYAEFYYVWVPENVGSIRYTIVAAGDDLCASEYFVTAFTFIQAFGGYPDFSLGFPCPVENVPFCSSWDAWLVGANDSAVYSVNQFSSGQYHYISVTKGTDEMTCSYNLTAQVEFQCPDHQVPVYSSFTCVSVTNVTSGQVVSKTIQPEDQDVYRYVVPQNVSRIWVGLTSNTSNVKFTNGVGYAVTDSHDNTYYVNYLGYNETTALYYWVTHIELPYGDFPTYFAVAPSVPCPTSYNISFYWSNCGANSAGLGYAEFTASTELIQFLSPDCSYPYTNNHLPLMNGTYTLGIAAGGIDFIAFFVPEETVGFISMDCVSTISSVYIALARNQFSACYEGIPLCSTGTPGIVTEFVSEVLWTGGDWYLAICNMNEGLSNVTISVTAIGVITPVPSPGASPSPSSQVDSGAPKMLPVLLFVILVAAALVQM